MKTSARLMVFTWVLVAFQLVAVVGVYRTASNQPYLRPYFPAEKQPLLPSTQAPLADHVVVFVFDGARFDVTMDPATAPAVAALRHAGTTYLHHETNYLSDSWPSHATLGTGNYPYQHQVINNDARVRPASETIFEVVQEANMTTATIASPCYEALFGPALDHAFEANASDDHAVTKDLSAELLRLLAAPSTFPNLTFVHFVESDHAGHAHGGASPQARAAVAHQDAQVGYFLGNLSTSPLAGRTTVLLTADHGMTDSAGGTGEGTGRHGWSSEAELHVPMVLWGAGIRENLNLTTRTNHVDVAETIACLLGTRAPKDSTGTILVDALTVTQEPGNPYLSRHLHNLVYRNLAQIERFQQSNWRIPADQAEMILFGTPAEKRTEATAYFAGIPAQRELATLEFYTRDGLEAMWNAAVRQKATAEYIGFTCLMLTSLVVAVMLLHGEGEGLSFATMNLKGPKIKIALGAVGALIVAAVPVGVHARAITAAGLVHPTSPGPLAWAVVNAAIPVAIPLVVGLVKGKDLEDKLAIAGMCTVIILLGTGLLGIGFQAYHFGIYANYAPFTDLKGVWMGYFYLTGLFAFVVNVGVFIPGKVIARRRAFREGASTPTVSEPRAAAESSEPRTGSDAPSDASNDLSPDAAE